MPTSFSQRPHQGDSISFRAVMVEARHQGGLQAERAHKLQISCLSPRAHRGVLDCAQVPSCAEVMPQTAGPQVPSTAIEACRWGHSESPFWAIAWDGLHSKAAAGTDIHRERERGREREKEREERQRDTDILESASPILLRTHTQSTRRGKPKSLPPGRGVLHFSHLWHSPLFPDAASEHRLSNVLTLSMHFNA